MLSLIPSARISVLVSVAASYMLTVIMSRSFAMLGVSVHFAQCRLWTMILIGGITFVLHGPICGFCTVVVLHSLPTMCLLFPLRSSQKAQYFSETSRHQRDAAPCSSQERCKVVFLLGEAAYVASER